MSKKTTTYVTLLNEREEELKAAIAVIKTSEDKNRSTKLHNKNRERKIVHLVSYLMSLVPDTTKFDEMSQEALATLSTLAEERVRFPKIEVHAGDKLFDLMEKYDRKDIYRKLMDAIEEAGLHLNKETGIVEE